MRTFFLFFFITFSPILAISFKNTDEMLAYVKSLLPKNPIILEAGAHFGEDTIRMKAVWPNAVMHIFEPLPSSFEIMIQATKHLTDVMCYPYALTITTGMTHFYIDVLNHGASSINYPVEWNQHEFNKTPIEVPCITLHEWAQLNQIKKIDFMWLDMEGHELYALQNGLELLRTVKVIYTEISFVPVRENSCSYYDLKKFLLSHGFREIWKSGDSGRYADALFVKKTNKRSYK